ncbi:MAG: alkylhydroperoxidase [Ilumatobacteraceae bacterium]|nr:alkylhydroperoxidase [Ilumatobacteraceae bacterium]MCU1390420.1 alkylhydroperoxidase [Ilumatobacteraceae bacterium]
MTQRLSLANVSPDLYKHLAALEGNIAANVEHSLYHLIKLRASMINGCAFCIDMHSTDALKSGETTARLFGLNAWWETPLYTDREIAALRLTDAVTRFGEHGVSDDVYDAAAAEFGDAIPYIVAAIGMINLWNRLAITFQATPASALATA